MNIYIDEAGRGPIAGPVCVGAVFLCDADVDLSDYDDSKKLSENRRVRLYSDIQKLQKDDQIIYANAFASPKEIDHNGIVWAIRFAIIRALYKISKYIYPQRYVGCYIKKVRKWLKYQKKIGDEVRLVIDGNTDFGLFAYLDIYIKTIIKGDAQVKAISMASIIAKVSRDKYMCGISEVYSDYGFAKHKGYGTKLHYEMIKIHGLSDQHRKTWIK